MKLLVISSATLALLLSVGLFSPRGARAEQLPIKIYTTADGLAHNHINRNLRDSRGFLWFCTTDNKVLFTRPDEVWNQCGIQFRMINCSSNRPGCPDLMVESRDNILPLECELGGIRNFKHMRQNRSLALGLPGVDRDLPMVLTVSQVSGPCLNVIPLDVAEL